MKTLETIAHAQIEFFIFIIRVPHVSSIDIYARAIDTLWENEIIVYMNICSTHFKLNKMSKIFDFDRILKTECNLLNFTRNCRIKNLWKSWVRHIFVESRTFKCEEERNDHMLHCVNRCLVMFLRGGKVNVVEYWWNIVAELKVNKDHSPNDSATKNQKY